MAEIVESVPEAMEILRQQTDSFRDVWGVR